MGRIKLIFVLFLITAFLLLVYIDDKQSEPEIEKWHEYFAAIDSEEIQGRLSFVDPNYNRIHSFKLLAEPGRTYYCRILSVFPNSSAAETNDWDKDKDFIFFAKPGDSISRHKFSDTLLLVKNNQQFIYYWHRFNKY
ncbi:MAG: hypothetical protein JWO06_2922 [Bacteroidota bacterium]|nr:hypothetical protein [Bacteroidota bacterium]